MTSCNNDDNSTQNSDNGLTLYKTVIFSPTKEAYNTHIEGSTKNVKYYENNLVVADTLYNQNGEAQSWGNHMYATNSHFSSHNDLNYPETLYTVEETYDSDGKILQEKTTFYQNGAISSVDRKTFTYTNNFNLIQLLRQRTLR